ncbi:MAG: hypothetical protein K1Y01_05855 [Vicinamibacteria bacterium]|nr:hypothetical protein [Vicinamibacteria bacterium]
MIRRPWARALFLRLAALSIGAILAFAVAETGARLLESRRARERPGSPRLALFDPNPHGTGSYRLKPNLRLTAEVEGRTVAVETNSHGMRWRETAVEKPKGTRRIAILGDSFAFGCWSSTMEKSFAGVMEQGLGPGVEVLNFGVGGYGFEDELLLLREEVLKFAPDEIVIASFNGNDIRDSFLDTTRYVVRDGAAELADDALEARVPAPYRTAAYVNPQPVPPPGLLGILWHSALARLVLRATDRDPPYLNYEVSRRFTSYSFWSQSPYPDVARQAVDHSLGLLDEMRRLAEERGPRLSLVAIPTAEQVYAIHPAGPGFDISLPQAYLGKWAGERSVPFLDLLPVLREAARASGRRPYLRFDVHFNDLGHRIAGEAMASWARSRPAPR